MSRDAKWLVRMIVATIIAVGVAAVAVSVTVLQFNRIATDMRNHEHRTNASNTQTILALQTLVHGMRDDYRDGMQVVVDVLHELQAIKRRLNDGDECRDESNTALRRDLKRALSNVEHALTVSLLFRPVRTSDLTRRLDEIQDELKALTRHLDRTEESDDDGDDGSDDDGDDGSDDDGTAALDRARQHVQPGSAADRAIGAAKRALEAVPADDLAHAAIWRSVTGL